MFSYHVVASNSWSGGWEVYLNIFLPTKLKINFEWKELLKELILSSSATATLNYRASLNSAPDKPSPVPTNTGNTTIVLSHLCCE